MQLALIEATRISEYILSVETELQPVMVLAKIENGFKCIGIVLSSQTLFSSS